MLTLGKRAPIFSTVMTIARVLGGIGRTFISTGVIILLFVAYQLWGTGVQEARAQGRLADDFAELRATFSDPELVDPGTTTTPAEPGDAAANEDDPVLGADDPAAPTEAEPVAVEALDPADFDINYLKAVYPQPGEQLLRIVMEDINVDRITVEGVGVDDLRKGPGHYRTTPMPCTAGNASIAGHRTTYGAPFHRVDELQPGDEIQIETLQGVCTYRVREYTDADGVARGYFIVSPSATEVLGQETGENLLTLTACHPKYTARQRIIVVAELVGEPFPTLPRPKAARAAQQAKAEDLASEGLAAEDPADGGDGSLDEEIPDDTDVVISDEVAADDDAGAIDQPIDDGTDEAAADEPAAADVDLVDLEDDDFEYLEDEDEITDDFGEGLGGDQGAILPSVTWGLAAGNVWLAAWFVGKRFKKKWWFYAIGFVPFFLLLWFCFVHIDEALPAY